MDGRTYHSSVSQIEKFETQVKLQFCKREETV